MSGLMSGDGKQSCSQPLRPSSTLPPWGEAPAICGSCHRLRQPGLLPGSCREVGGNWLRWRRFRSPRSRRNPRHEASYASPGRCRHHPSPAATSSDGPAGGRAGVRLPTTVIWCRGRWGPRALAVLGRPRAPSAPLVPLVIWAEASFSPRFCPRALCATDVMGWESGEEGTGPFMVFNALGPFFHSPLTRRRRRGSFLRQLSRKPKHLTSGFGRGPEAGSAQSLTQCLPPSIQRP